MEEVKQAANEEQAIASIEQTAIQPTALTDPKQLNTLVKLANMMSRSKLVPDSYRNDPDSCFVACEMANRMGVSPMVVMQSLYIVQGRPAWSGQACISLINGTGLFGPLNFVFVGEKGTPSYGCYVQATRKSDGAIITGTVVDYAMAEAEGWTSKKGSKWLTMGDQMLQYRAAAFFARVHCPHALMGLQTVEEVKDIKGDEPEKVTIKLS